MNDEHPDAPRVAMPPPLIHLGAIALGYGLDRFFGWRFPVGPELAMLAVVLLMPGILLVLWTILVLRQHQTTVLPHRAASSLVTRGPFRLSRNPIYLGFVLLHLACGLSLGSPGILLMLFPVFYVMNAHVIAEEEAFHHRKFGEQWEAYSRSVRRWV